MRILSIVLKNRDPMAIYNNVDFKNGRGRKQNLSRNGSSVHLMNYV